MVYCGSSILSFLLFGGPGLWWSWLKYDNGTGEAGATIATSSFCNWLYYHHVCILLLHSCRVVLCRVNVSLLGVVC
ncbi:hypothetical protein T440DRAFT_468672 [Plenodomus tracheiphilus IPT5]|uniref:Uncharacterized protein n=1 Tax=Plenodomus tracheiphilus IPT5 TaxID=1408161 RepID=A0A6A7B7L1_9PLEO|nr:hypothetical protein T440DRAFT_468672 [Plenodomus tracheiphilus IPT5]